MQNQTPAGRVPRLLIKIINEPRDAYDQPRFVDTPDGRQHTFLWNAALGAYTCEVTDQLTADLIFALNWTLVTLPWHFVPVHPANYGGGAVAGSVAPVAVATAAIPPYVRPDLYAGYPTEDLQALARDCGFPIQGDPNNAENLKRQLAAYYVGRSWANEELKRIRIDMDTLRKAPPPPVPVAHTTPVILPPAIVVPQAPMKRKRGRPPKVRPVALEA